METENPLADSDAEPSSPVAEDGEIVTGTAENKDAARSSKAWVVDDEAALMSEFNRSGGDLLRRDVRFVHLHMWRYSHVRVCLHRRLFGCGLRYGASRAHAGGYPD